MLDLLPKSAKQQAAIWRQGDVFIIAVPNLPHLGRVERRPVLAEGEVTGHTHALADPAAGRIFVVRGEIYLEVVADSATIVHEEHAPVTLPRGGYAIRIQREYSPKEIRQVVD